MSLDDSDKSAFQSPFVGGCLVRLLKLPAWKIGVAGSHTRSGIQVLKKQNVSSPLTRKDSIVWGASVTDR